MGERIGYRTRDKYGISQIIRKQWMKNVQEVVTGTWNTLGGNPDNGMQAIRQDLGNDRAFAALVSNVYDPPFDSIHEDVNCDIVDHGLVEIDVTDYKNWQVYHYEIDWHNDFSKPSTLDEKSKTLYATMNGKGFKKVTKIETIDWT